jgi:hypothetical protein
VGPVAVHDRRFFGMLKQAIRALTQAIEAVAANPELQLDPLTLKPVSCPVPPGGIADSVLTRCLGLQSRIDVRGCIINTVAILNTFKAQYQRAVVSGFKLIGWCPLNRQLLLHGDAGRAAAGGTAGTGTGTAALDRLRRTCVETRAAPADAIALLQGHEGLTSAERTARVDAAVALLVRRVPSPKRDIELQGLIPIAPAPTAKEKRNMSLGANGTMTTRAEYERVLALPVGHATLVNEQGKRAQKRKRVAGMLASLDAEAADVQITRRKRANGDAYYYNTATGLEVAVDDDSAALASGSACDAGPAAEYVRSLPPSRPPSTAAALI